MLFSDRPRTIYRNAPTHEVICQLRFPTILSINSTEPADFQELIRDEFPQYLRQQQSLPPKIIGAGTPNPRVEQQPPITNYAFLSADGKWKLNLTRDFIALSTIRYSGWEEFARHLDKPLASFIKLYHPAYFQRVGLRYVNIISREKLGLEGTPWTELMAPAYTGPLIESDVREENLAGYNCDFTMKLDSSCHAKIHAGPGLLKSKDPRLSTDNEQRFILDFDLFMTGNITAPLAAAGMETLHNHADALFQGAITDELHEAML